MIVVDTNLLCRLAHRGHAHSAIARNALSVLRSRGEQLAIFPQNIFEFWTTATRGSGAPPAGQNGLGLSVFLADKWVDYFQKRFAMLPDKEQILPLWRDLVRVHKITGQKCHDVRIVAAMQSYGIADLLTFNLKDFRRFSFLNLIDPQSL